MKSWGDYYNAQFWGSPASEYLRSRGIRHSTIQRFNLGYVGKPAPGHWQYRGRLAIPFVDGLGRERGIRYRKLPGDPSDAKYLAVKGFSHLFAVRAADHPIVYLTEGEIDAMVLWQLGYRAVGVPGAKVWKDYMRFLFRNCEEVVLTLDNDDPEIDEKTGKRKPNAGQQATVRIYRDLERTGIPTRAVRLPKGSDVNETYQELGEKGLRDLLEAA